MSFADNDKADQAYLWAAQARLDEASGNKDKAIQAWEEALRQTPLHPFFRTELQRLLMERKACSLSTGTFTPRTPFPLSGQRLCRIRHPQGRAE